MEGVKIMAICTRCGAVTSNEDKNHICDEADVPKKGEEKKPQMTTVVKGD